MRYTVDNTDEIADLWAGVFSMLSVNQFKKFWRVLGFPIHPSDELQVISRDFVLSYDIYLGNAVPEQPSVQLRDDADKGDPAITIWNTTCSRLEEIGYADAVYQWGRQTKGNYYGQTNQIIQELNWDALLTDWSKDPENPGFVPLRLSPQKKVMLQTLIFRHDDKSWELRQQLKQTERSVISQWEQYAFEVLHVGPWMYTQARFMATITKWNDIFDVLSDEEIKILQEWGWQQFEKIGIRERVPLVRFKL